jgi:hypothetical protein
MHQALKARSTLRSRTDTESARLRRSAQAPGRLPWLPAFFRRARFLRARLDMRGPFSLGEGRVDASCFVRGPGGDHRGRRGVRGSGRGYAADSSAGMRRTVLVREPLIDHGIDPNSRSGPEQWPTHRSGGPPTPITRPNTSRRSARAVEGITTARSTSNLRTSKPAYVARRSRDVRLPADAGARCQRERSQVWSRSTLTWWTT